MQKRTGVIPKRSLNYKIRYVFGKTLIAILEFFLSFFIKRSVFFDNEEFMWSEKIESKYPEIYSEYQSLRKNMRRPIDVTELSEEQLAVIEEDRWHFIPLFLYGQKIDVFTGQAPVTTALLEQIPDMTTAIFSTITPEAKIKEHRGAYKGILRYHLGIEVPQNYEDCSIFFQGGDMKYSWKNGEGVFFDDTYKHYVENNTSQYRTVLYVDFLRPMPILFKKISYLLIKSLRKSPYVQNMLIKLKKYENECNA